MSKPDHFTNVNSVVGTEWAGNRARGSEDSKQQPEQRPDIC